MVVLIGEVSTFPSLIGILRVVFFRGQHFYYDHMASRLLQICFVFIDSRCQRLNGYYLGGLLFLNSFYLLITFLVLHKSRFSPLTSDLLHSLFQLNGF